MDYVRTFLAVRADIFRFRISHKNRIAQRGRATCWATNSLRNYSQHILQLRLRIFGGGHAMSYLEHHSQICHDVRLDVPVRSGFHPRLQYGVAKR